MTRVSEVVLALWRPLCIDCCLNLARVQSSGARHLIRNLCRTLTNRTRHRHLVFEALQVRAMLAAIFTTTPAVEFVQHGRNLGRYPVRVPGVFVGKLARV